MLAEHGQAVCCGLCNSVVHRGSVKHRGAASSKGSIRNLKRQGGSFRRTSVRRKQDRVPEAKVTSAFSKVYRLLRVMVPASICGLFGARGPLGTVSAVVNSVSPWRSQNPSLSGYGATLAELEPRLEHFSSSLG